MAMYGQTDGHLMIVESTTAQVLLDQKPVGQARLPVGQEYEFLGLSGDRYLLRTGQTIFSVDPLATDYLERGLLTQLGWQSAVSTAAETAVESTVQIYAPEPSPLEVRRTMEAEQEEPVRPFRRIVQRRYAPGYFFPYAGYYYSPGCVYGSTNSVVPPTHSTFSLTIKLD
jgi:hypothetical protein